MESELEFTGKPYPHWKRRFFTIWTGQAISLLGSQMVSFAIIWYLTEQTGSATVLSMTSLFNILPAVIIAPIAGTFVDRNNRKWIMIVSDLVTGLVRLLGVFLFASGLIQVWHIYAMIFISSAAGAFQGPANTASSALMVPRKSLSRVAGMNQVLNGALNIVGAPLGALLMSVTTIPTILLIDFVTMLLAIIPLFFIPIPQPEAKTDDNGAVIKKTFFADLKEGFQFILSWPGLGLLLVIIMMINFFISPAMNLIPLLVSQFFGKTEVELALLNSIIGVCMLVGGLILSVWGGFKKRIFTAYMGLLLAGIGIGMVGFIPSTGFKLSLIAFGLIALTLPLINGTLSAVFQASIPPEIQGRALSSISFVSKLAMPIGTAIAGPVSDAIGIQSWFIIGGVAMLFSGILGFLLPNLRNVESKYQSHDLNPLTDSTPDAS
jgi:DHA3 family macrolide efflux protein-like MFS transporter